MPQNSLLETGGEQKIPWVHPYLKFYHATSMHWSGGRLLQKPHQGAGGPGGKQQPGSEKEEGYEVWEGLLFRHGTDSAEGTNKRSLRKMIRKPGFHHIHSTHLLSTSSFCQVLGTHSRIQGGGVLLLPFLQCSKIQTSKREADSTK